MKNFSKKVFLLLISLVVSMKAEKNRTSETEQIFTTIYDNSHWWTGETYSGIGSNMHQTQLIRQEIPKIIQRYGIRSILDIPCGDFHWMKKIIGTLSVSYVGADIVKTLIDDNQVYSNEKISFIQLDIITDNLPCVDLIFCRDCLVHLSFAQIWQALRNMKRSGSRYLLTTGYSDIKNNTDIVTGSWRPLNLMVEPFNLKNPLLVFNEGYERDKCLVLWDIADLNI